MQQIGLRTFTCAGDVSAKGPRRRGSRRRGGGILLLSIEALYSVYGFVSSRGAEQRRP